MITRIEHALTVATPAGVPTQYNVGNAQLIRFHKVPSSFTVRLDSATSPAIEIDGPMSLERCGQPFTKIFVENAIGIGTAGPRSGFARSSRKIRARASRSNHAARRSRSPAIWTC